jgi:hypothetical protein
MPLAVASDFLATPTTSVTVAMHDTIRTTAYALKIILAIATPLIKE